MNSREKGKRGERAFAKGIKKEPRRRGVGK